LHPPQVVRCASGRGRRAGWASSAYTGGGSATYTYDSGTYGKGHLTEVADGTGNTQWTYDQYGRVTQRQQTVGSIVLTVSYAYDTDGRLHTITYPSGKVATYSYSANGQVSGLTFNSIGVTGSVTWMPFGGINTWSTSAGVTFTRSFDEDYRITSLALGSVNTQSLTWDVASRLTGLTETGLSAKSYGYDSLDRLTSVTIGTASPTTAGRQLRDQRCDADARWRCRSSCHALWRLSCRRSRVSGSIPVRTGRPPLGCA
jgi:YD repeat-containing protein